MFGVSIAVAAVLSSMGPVIQGTSVSRFAPEPTNSPNETRAQRGAKTSEFELVEVQVRAIFRIPFEFLTKSAKSSTTASTWRS